MERPVVPDEGACPSDGDVACAPLAVAADEDADDVEVPFPFARDVASALPSTWVTPGVRSFPTATRTTSRRSSRGLASGSLSPPLGTPSVWLATPAFGLACAPPDSHGTTGVLALPAPPVDCVPAAPAEVVDPAVPPSTSPGFVLPFAGVAPAWPPASPRADPVGTGTSESPGFSAPPLAVESLFPKGNGSRVASGAVEPLGPEDTVDLASTI